jgi:TPR repeat protein
VYYYPPAWQQAQKYWSLAEQEVKALVEKYAKQAEAAGTAAAPEPAAPSAPVAEPAPAPAPEPAPEPVVAEPEPAPLPALNAEAEALLPKAEAGDPVAQFNLARQYALGEGMAVNREEFIRWCRTAADQGLPEAQYALGCCYLRGLAVPQDAAEGRRLLEAAAAAGFAPAAEELKR